jgi:hypothetical protein
MKKIFVYSFLLAAVIGFLFFLASSCPNDEGDYYIKFKADGVQKEFRLGLTDYESNALGMVSPIDSSIILFATPETWTNLTSNPANFVGIIIFGTAPGTYTIADLDINYTVEQAEYFPVTEASVTITNIGAVGEEITGTFSATVEYNPPDGGVPPSDLEIIITDGEFKVKRISDDAIPIPDGE